MSDSSDDELPLAQRNGAGSFVAKKPESAAQKAPASAPKPTPPPAKVSTISAAVKVDPDSKSAPASASKAASAAKTAQAAKPAAPVKKAAAAPPKKAAADTKKENSGTGAGKAAVNGAKPRAPKKEFDLPGQTKESPDEGEPLAKFYMSLLQQRPESEIANKWCIQHGFCSKEHAQKWLARNGKAVTSPTKRPPAAKREPKKETEPKRKSTGSAAPRRPAPKRPSAKRGDRVFDDDDDGGDGDDGNDSEPEALPVSARSKPKAAAAKQAPAPKPVGDDSSHDDDMPLAKRVRV